MKRLLSIISLATITILSCNNPASETKVPIVENKIDSTALKGESYGEKIDMNGAISMDSLVALVTSGKTTIENVKVKGKIEAVCQAKGCWMDVTKTDSSNMHVSFNEEFFIPLNSTGKNAVFMGTAYMDTTTVEALKHYAEDEGKSKKEIAKITSPEIRLAFDAKGVILN